MSPRNPGPKRRAPSSPSTAGDRRLLARRPALNEPRAWLDLDLERWTLRAGEALRGVVALHAPAGAAVTQVRLALTGREVLGATPHYQPAVYEEPLPRPWGRIRSGHAKLLYAVEQSLLPDDRAAQGKQTLTFQATVPADALPTYGGLGAFCEHDVLVTATVDGQRVQAWQPLHVWAAPSPPPAAGPLALAASGRGLGLTVRAPAARLALGESLRLRWSIDNPQGLRTKNLVLELSGRETARNWAATDVHEYIVARHQVSLRDGALSAGEVHWTLPRRLAPDLRGPRFRLTWQLRAQVTLPWRLGVAGSAPLALWDPAHEAPGEDNAAPGETTAAVDD